MAVNILNLSAYDVLQVDENEHDYHVTAVTLKSTQPCPHCQSGSPLGFGRREQMIRDLPMHGKRVGLYIETKRYRCRGCSKTYYEALPEIDEKRLMTKRLTAWMGKQAIKRTFASIAERRSRDPTPAKSVPKAGLSRLADARTTGIIAKSASYGSPTDH